MNWEPSQPSERSWELGLDATGLLQTHAEVGTALAGFASVVAALRRPLSEVERQRFLSLLALSLIQVLGCLLPLWVVDQLAPPAPSWRILSIVLLGLYVARLWWLVIIPSRVLGPGVRLILNPLATRFLWGVALFSAACLASNAIGLPLRPGFHLYYAGHLGMLLVGFMLFADVVVAKSQGSTL